MPTKKEIRLYGDLVYKHKISIRTIIHQLILDFFAKRRRLKKSVYRGGIPEYNTYVPPKVDQLV
jgi:predicted DNA-binding transcriptional regulator